MDRAACSHLPFVTPPLSIKPEWIDANGHLNLAFYSVLFDEGQDHALDIIGLGERHRSATGMACFVGDLHIRYRHELKVTDRVVSTVQLIGHDAKRIHVYQELRHLDGRVSASAEAMLLSVDRSGPRVAPFAADVLVKLAEIQSLHDSLPLPDDLGRTLRVPRR